MPLLSIGKSVTALDLSDDMLDILRATASPDADLDILRADMRDFVTDQRFELIVIAATSIILLDTGGRRRLFDTVRRHLVPGGRFAFSVAGAGATAELRRTVDREVTVTRDGRPIDYVSSQELIADGRERIVNFAPIAAGAADPIFTTRLHLVDEAMASAEIVAAGFLSPTVHLVRTAAARPGEAIVILETSWPS
jgi:SAM-dependent methyltransferase